MTAELNELDELLSRLPNIELFAIFMRPTDKFRTPFSDEGRPLLVAHLKFLFDLEERGILLASGPLDLDVERIEGMCVVRAATRENAELIAAEEPYAKVGWRENTVRAWQLNEGLLAPHAQAINSS